MYYAIDPHVLTRFWREAEATRDGDAWTARCPIMSTDQPLYVLANVYYPRKNSLEPHRWLDFRETEHFAISSEMVSFAPADLKAKAKATDKPSLLIDDFSRRWHDWYRLEWRNPVHWVATTRKPKDPKWRGDAGRKLLLDVRTDKPNTLVFRVEFAAWGAYPELRQTRYFAVKPLAGTGDWETVTLLPQDFQPVRDGWPDAMPGWQYVTQLTLAARAVDERGGEGKIVGGRWQGAREFRNLRWVP
jgi:hypothetical protein